MPLLEVKDLKTHYKTESGRVKAADGISFTLDEGESVGIAGESGCGKTTVIMSLMRLVDHRDIVGGKIILDGQSILEMTDDQFRHLRWKKISMVSQAAMGALNPVFTIGWQIIEALREHDKTMTKADALVRTQKLLEQVGIDPSRVHTYPHELSGGMRQRAMIAMALACEPKIVIADEMTTALDVVTQVQILKLFQELQARMNLSVIAISHELPILGQICENIMIMYAGKMVEKGPTDIIFSNPLHPYTKWLLESLVDIEAERKAPKGIPGRPPSLLNPPPGCRFAPRCRLTEPVCSEVEPPLIEVAPKHIVACHLVKK